MPQSSPKPISLLTLSIVLCSIIACERPTTLTIKGGNPPTFLMTGNATFNGVRVRGPKVRATSGEDQYIVWEIRGTSEWVNTVSPLIYGKVPSGYKQVYPEQGEAPPIVEGERYFVRILTTGAKGAEKYFTIRNGKVIEEEF